MIGSSIAIGGKDSGRLFLMSVSALLSDLGEKILLDFEVHYNARIQVERNVEFIFHTANTLPKVNQSIPSAHLKGSHIYIHIRMKTFKIVLCCQWKF